MKKNYLLILLALVIPPIFLTGFLPPMENTYVILGWNDLGMHCANKDFDSIVILPPYNNFRAQAVLKGDAQTLPSVVNSGLHMNYSIPGNTYSAGKTNFWDYEDVLFGVNLPENIGLTGAGLTGTMAAADNHFWVDGVPITPYTDDNLTTEDPYQLALLELFDGNDQLLASTQSVMPVSGEINCVSAGCHRSEKDILNRHEREGGFNPNNTPILCSQCHADVALGMPGNSEAGPLSYVVHNKHKNITNDCYKCHPGPNTQCFRGVMHDDGLTCQTCHGNLSQVAQSIHNGRRPWLDEPSCGAASCHGSNYAEEPGKLFKESKGHGGLYCSACHGSPHAILPSGNPRDNVQNIALQGHAGALDDCTVCHGVVPQGAGPHGYTPVNLSADATLIDLTVDGTTISNFSPTTLSYVYYVETGTTQVPTVGATPNNPGATADITPASSLPGTTSILVTAENGVNTLTYSVDFEYSQSDDATLIDLTVDGTTIDNFSPTTLDYIYYVEAGTSIVPTVGAIPNNPGANAAITPTNTLPGTTSILVTAENGVSTLTYTVDFEFTQANSTCEGFESGVPHDYYTGNLNLQSGTWYGRNVKRSSSSHEGERSIQLRKETTSYLQTLSFNGVGTVTFWYRGSEDHHAKFSFQKKVGGSHWVTLATVNFSNNRWHEFSYDVNSSSNNIKFRVITDSRQRSILSIDEFCVTSYTNINPGGGDDDHLKATPVISEANIRVYSVVRDVYVTFTFPDDVTAVNGQINIYDLSGKLVTSRKVSNSGTEMITLSVNSGMYIVAVTANGKYYTKKVIIH